MFQFDHGFHFGGGLLLSIFWLHYPFFGNGVLELDEEDGLGALPSPSSYNGRGGEGALLWEALPHPHFQGRESARAAGQCSCDI